MKSEAPAPEGTGAQLSRQADTASVTDFFGLGAPDPTVSRQVAWWPVYEYAAAEAARLGVNLAADPLPVPGTPQWCAMPDGDRKLAAVLLLGAQYVLALDTRQEALADASKAVAAAADWPQISRDIRQRTEFYAARPWLKRVTA